MVPPTMKGMEGMIISGWAFTIATGNMVIATTIGRIMPRRTTALTIAIRPVSNGHHQDSRDGVGNKSKFSMRAHTRIHKIESGSECYSKCSVASNYEEHLKEEAVPTPVSSKN